MLRPDRPPPPRRRISDHHSSWTEFSRGQSSRRLESLILDLPSYSKARTGSRALARWGGGCVARLDCFGCFDFVGQPKCVARIPVVDLCISGCRNHMKSTILYHIWITKGSPRLIFFLSSFFEDSKASIVAGGVHRRTKTRGEERIGVLGEASL